MHILIHDRELAEDEALEKTLVLIARHGPTMAVEVFVQHRIPMDALEYKRPGWLEYGILFTNEVGNKMYIALIQRRPGEPFESHS